MPVNSGPESVADLSAGRPESKKKNNNNDFERYTKNAGT